MRIAISVLACFLGAGCGIKKVEEKPEVGVVVLGAQPSPTVGLNFAGLWDPEDRDALDVTSGIKKMLIEQHLSSHVIEFLAPAIVGTTANLQSAGMESIVAAAVLTEQYPRLAKELATKWKDGFIKVASSAGSSVDSTTVGSGGASARQLVIRVKNGTDAQLQQRFEEYLARVEEAIESQGETVTAHERGGQRSTGPLSTIYYETPSVFRGTVSTVLIRKLDVSDAEFNSLLLAEEQHMLGQDWSVVKSRLSNDHGPYLVVLVSEQK